MATPSKLTLTPLDPSIDTLHWVSDGRLTIRKLTTNQTLSVPVDTDEKLANLIQEERNQVEKAERRIALMQTVLDGKSISHPNALG